MGIPVITSTIGIFIEFMELPNNDNTNNINTITTTTYNNHSSSYTFKTTIDNTMPNTSFCFKVFSQKQLIKSETVNNIIFL